MIYNISLLKDKKTYPKKIQYIKCYIILNGFIHRILFSDKTRLVI